MSLTPEQATLKLSSPYKGLMPYTEEDVDYFFGREVEEKIIAANLMVARLTLLYGESGVGKSSVLRAGVVQTLVEQATQKLDNYQRPGYVVVVFSSWQDDPVTGLLAEVEKAVTKLYARYDLVPPTYSGDLAETLAAWTEQEAIKGKLLIILDQFEEYFLYHPQEAEDSFVRQFSLAVNQTDLKVNFLLSIREDQLSKLDRFKGRIPGLFENYIRIDYLNREAAGRAIIEPIKKYNQEFGTAVTIEPELVEKVLDELEGGKVQITSEGSFTPGKVQEKRESGIETPYLQLVMTRLWDEEMRSGSSQVRLATLEKLKGAEQIVRSHLDEVLATLTPAELAVAARIFRYLATPNGSKIAQSAADLAEFADLNSSEEKARLGKVLEELSSGDNRILRPVQSPGGKADDTRYEIFHDVLGKAILEWRTRYVAEQKVLETERANRARVRRFALWGVGLVGLLVILGILTTFSILSATDANNQRGIANDQRNIAYQQGTVAAKNADEAYKQATIAAGAATRATNAEATAVANSNEAIRLKNEAELQGKIALSRQLAAQSSYSLNKEENLPVALPLALEAFKISETKEARDSLIDSYNYYPGLYKNLQLDNATVDVDAIAISPNGKFIAARGYKLSNFQNESADIRIWDVENGKLIQEIEEKLTIGVSDGGILRFSPDSNVLAFSTPDYLIKLFDVKSGNVVQEFYGHTSLILDLAFNPTGQILASASQDNTIALWDTNNGKQIAAFDSRSYKLTFLPDGKTLASYGVVENQLYYWLWDTSNGQAIKKVLIGQYFSKVIAKFSQDSTKLISVLCNRVPIDFYTCPSTTAVVIDTATGKITNQLDLSTFSLIYSEYRNGTLVLDAAFNPDNTSVDFLVLYGQKYQIINWNLTTTTNPLNAKVLLSNLGYTKNFLLSPDDKLVITGGCINGCDQEAIKIWDLEGNSHKSIRYEENSGNISNLIVTQNGEKLISASNDNNIRIWNTGTGKQNALLSGHTGPVNYIRISPDGKFIASISDDKTVRLWDIDSGKEVRKFTGHIGVGKTVSFSLDGKLLISGGCIVNSLSNGDTPLCGTGEIIIWDIQSGQILKKITGVGMDFNALEVVPNEKQFVTATCETLAGYTCKNINLITWNLETGVETRRLDISFEFVSKLAFSPDGKTLGISGCGRFDIGARCVEGKVSLLNFISGKQVGESIIAHAGIIYGFTFSSDGKYFITGSCGERNTYRCALGQLAIWDTMTLRNIGTTINVGTGYIHALVFTPDGKSFISAECTDTHEANTNCLTDELQTWVFQPLETQVCQIANRNLTLDEWKKYLGDAPYKKTCLNLS